MSDKKQTVCRPATRADLPTIVSFQLAMASETEGITLDRSVCSRGVEAIFEDRSLGRYFVAEVEGNAVSSLLITYEWSDWRNGVVWWIQSVFVTSEQRRAGIYSTLYEYVKRLAVADEKVQGIRLYVDRRNVAAQQTYRKLGMNGEHYQVFEWMRSF